MIALVADFPGVHRFQTGGKNVTEQEWQRILSDASREAGLTSRNSELLFLLETPPKAGLFKYAGSALPRGRAALHARLRSMKPSAIVAFGADVLEALVPGVDPSMENARGYVFDSDFGPVVASMAPWDVARAWAPWRTLLSFDLQRAQEISRNGLVRPTREVAIIGSDRDARRAVGALRRQRDLSADIETWGDTSLACVGFAGESGKAYVFPAQYLHRASELLEDPDLTTIWANGIYDLFVLKHREGVRFRARVDDAQIMWHAAYPELAGAKEDKRKHRFTRKSLAFLASLATFDRWWKGDYETEEEFYIYNGKDCCITHDVWHFVKKEAERVGALDTYEHERGLMWPCVDMLQRGLRVDEDLRQWRIAELEKSLASASSEAMEAVLPLLEREKETLEELGSIHLFQETDPTCECCRHASKKQFACWSCAGFESAPSKADLVERGGDPSKKKSELEEEMLQTCKVCKGAPREVRWAFNANSDTQMKVLLYDVLRLPRRMNKGSLTVNEAALKSLLGAIPT